MEDGIHCQIHNFTNENLLKHALKNGKSMAVIFDYDNNLENNCYCGEFLIYSSKYIIKAGGIECICIDNDTQTLYPPTLISALGLIYDIYKEDVKKHMPNHFSKYDIDSALDKINKNNVNRKSDIKSFFKAAAFLIDISNNDMKEFAVKNLKNINNEYEFNIRYTNKMFVVGTKDIILGLLSDIKKEEKKEIMSAKFYKSIIDISVFICKDLREFHGISKVLLAGKMFEEDESLRTIENELKRNGFNVSYNFSDAQ
ncbi:MAG: hypothetical protein GYA50_07955 [Eubacteriaceae bacterium]|nr:hypothetical protein [Eubacteriaceae bacterium]